MSKYWQDRFSLLERAEHDLATSGAQDIQDILAKAFSDVDKEINSFYAKYATEQGISLNAAQQYLQQNDLAAFKADIKDYTNMAMNNSDGRFNQILDALSARAHIQRLEALKIRTAMAVREAYGKSNSALSDAMGAVMQDTAIKTAYEIQNGIGKYEPFHQIDQKAINRALAKPWTDDGKTFSSRLWDNQTQLVNTLQEEFTTGFISGLDPAGMSKKVSEKFGVAEYAARRLVLTEGAYFAAEGAREGYKQMNVEKYQILATLDDKTSDICQAEDGKIYAVKDYDPGNNAPPFHPFCRSTTMPYFEDNVLGPTEQRTARDENGKTTLVPGILRYPDWKAVFVDKTKTIAAVVREATPKQAQSVKIPLKDRIEQARQALPQNYTDVDIIKIGQIVNDELANRPIQSVRNSAMDIVSQRLNDIRNGIQAAYDDYKARKIDYKEYVSRFTSLKDDQAKIDKVREFIARRNLKESTKIINEVRGTTTDLKLFKSIVTSARSKAFSYLKEAWSTYPASWIKDLQTANVIIKPVHQKGRAFYSEWKKEIHLNSKEVGIEAIKTALHESAHLFEHKRPNVLKMEKLFYDRRTKGESLESLRSLTGLNYQSWEMTRKDKFLHVYMGKDYRGTAYELLSMGVEELLTNPQKLISADPEFANFIYGILFNE